MFNQELVNLANALFVHCQNNTEDEGLDTLYAPDAVSVEAAAMEEGGGRTAEGVQAIKDKHAWWYGAFEVHSSTVQGPFFHGDDKFGLIFTMDTTMKETGDRMQASELGLYTVKDGKIVREEFFYMNE